MRVRRGAWWGGALAAAYLATYLYLRATCRGETCLSVGALAGPFLGVVEAWGSGFWAEPALLVLNLAALFAIGWAASALWSLIRRGDAR